MLYVGTSKGNIDKYEYDLYNNAYVLKESVSCNELNNIKGIYFVDNTLTENATLLYVQIMVQDIMTARIDL